MKIISYFLVLFLTPFVMSMESNGDRFQNHSLNHLINGFYFELC
jgi:hypothetical protein